MNANQKYNLTMELDAPPRTLSFAKRTNHKRQNICAYLYKTGHFFR